MGGNLKYLNCRLWSATDDMKWILIFKGNRSDFGGSFNDWFGLF